MSEVTHINALTPGKGAERPVSDDIEQVSQQLEALFLGMMIKSMRETIGENTLTGSKQQSTYQEMWDQQIAHQISERGGLGLQQMLSVQLDPAASSGSSGNNDRLQEQLKAVTLNSTPVNATELITRFKADISAGGN